MRILAGVLLLLALPALAPGDERPVRDLLAARDYARLKALGAPAVEELARLYSDAPEEKRVELALAFYNIGVKSSEAKRVLMKDVHTANTALRLQVQWALGR